MMAPRTYKLGRRAKAATATRKRILKATLELYRELGVAGTTLSAVAERADVARGTILHHFGSADGLLGAAVELLLEDQEFPDERIYDGLATRDDRIRAYVAAMIGFQERSSAWWPVFEGEMQRPELQHVEAEYWAALGKVQAAALGPELANDPRVNAALTGVVHPATVGTFMWSFEQAGLPRDDARPLLAEFAVSAIGQISNAERGKGGVA